MGTTHFSGPVDSAAGFSVNGVALADTAQINRTAVPTVQTLTASGAVTSTVNVLLLNHATVVIAATIADAATHAGLFYVTDTSASGTAAHTVTLTAGTWDGTHTIATLNAPNEAFVVLFDSAGAGTIVSNTGAVAFS